jgi:hypothetical protein
MWAKPSCIPGIDINSRPSRIGHNKTKTEAVTTALSEHIAHRKRLKILDLFGTVDFDASRHYKAERRKKR